MEEKVLKASLRGWVIAIAWSVFVGIIIMMGWYFVAGNYPEMYSGIFDTDWDWYTWYVRAYFFITLPMLIFSFVPKRLHRMSSRDLALIYIGTLTASAFTLSCFDNYGSPAWTFHGIIYEYIDHVARRGYDLVTFTQAFRPWLPDYPTEKDMLYLRHFQADMRASVRSIIDPVPFPLDKFIRPFIMWLIPMILHILTLIFLMSLLKKQFVDEEALPFPNTQLILAMIRSASEEDKESNIFKSKWTYLGVLLGIVLKLPDWIYLFYPYSITDWQNYMTIRLVIPVIPITIAIFSPGVIGFGLMIPTDILLSFFITWFVFDVVIMNVAGALGYVNIMPGWTMENFHQNAMYGPGSIGGPGVGGLYWTILGASFTIALWPIILNYRGWIAGLKAIIKPDPKTDKGAPLSHRYLWLGFITCQVLSLIYWATVGAALHVLLFMLPLYLLIYIAWARTVGEAGAWGGPVSAEFINQYVDLQKTTIVAWGKSLVANTIGLPSDYVPKGVNGISTIHFRTFLAPEMNMTLRTESMLPTGYLLEGYYVASAVNLRARDILLMTIITSILILIICPLLPMWQMATWTIPSHVQAIPSARRFQKAFTMPHIELCSSYAIYRGTHGFWEASAGGDTYPLNVAGTLPLFFAGLIGTAIIQYLRLRHPGFLYNPIGMIILLMGPDVSRIWFPALVALIIRYITIRTKGSKFFDEKILPIALGMIFASGVYYFIMGAAMFMKCLGTKI
ncbi:MAG: DUF6785 family protein [Candidatus Bathyarchaeia archaeon]